MKGEKGELQEVLVDKDDGCRPETTIESLGKLKPVLVKDGTGSTTAGNSS